MKINIFCHEFVFAVANSCSKYTTHHIFMSDTEMESIEDFHTIFVDLDEMISSKSADLGSMLLRLKEFGSKELSETNFELNLRILMSRLMLFQDNPDVLFENFEKYVLFGRRLIGDPNRSKISDGIHRIQDGLRWEYKKWNHEEESFDGRFCGGIFHFLDSAYFMAHYGNNAIKLQRMLC